jgi:DNA-binding response OmpR family regulator
MRILLVEDDRLLGDGIVAGLKQRGFAVDWSQDGAAADTALHTEAYAAVVLDLGLPKLSGLEVLRRLRANGNATPVLILTARDAIEDRVKGLDSGADDYLLKPFDLDELAARLRALLRRAHGAPAPTIQLGGVTLNPATREVRFHDQAVELSAREFDLLHELMLHGGQVLTREKLEQQLYAWGEEIGSNAIEVHVHHLRRKLAPELIRTVRGVGYVMAKDSHG